MADPLTEAVAEMLARADLLAVEVRELAAKTERLIELSQRRAGALRAAPMPFRESSLDIDGWLEAYSEWWHANASEEALGG